MNGPDAGAGDRIHRHLAGVRTIRRLRRPRTDRLRGISSWTWAGVGETGGPGAQGALAVAAQHRHGPPEGDAAGPLCRPAHSEEPKYDQQVSFLFQGAVLV